MSPVNTAELNPGGQVFCFTSPGNPVFIPILLNNVKLAGLRYSITPLIHRDDGGYGNAENFDLKPKDFKSIERIRANHSKWRLPFISSSEYEDNTQKLHSGLHPMQSVVYIQLMRSGKVRLERVLDTSGVDSRIVYPFETTVVACPRAEFVDIGPHEEDFRCSGHDPNFKFMVDVFGVPPLSLKWWKAINGRREHFSVQSIERGEQKHKNYYNSAGELETGLSHRETSVIPQELKIPLVISLDAAGEYLYVLEEIADAIGNVVHMGTNQMTTDRMSTSKTKTTRSLLVLRRPTVSFRHCGPGRPASILMGAETPLTISANTSDVLDTAWEVLVRYQPPIHSEHGVGKRFTPWERSFKTHGRRQAVSVQAIAPGDYTIVQVKGNVWCLIFCSNKFVEYLTLQLCPGNAVAPEVCQVVEKPLPTAQIKWKPLNDWYELIIFVPSTV